MSNMIDSEVKGGDKVIGTREIKQEKGLWYQKPKPTVLPYMIAKEYARAAQRGRIDLTQDEEDSDRGKGFLAEIPIMMRNSYIRKKLLAYNEDAYSDYRKNAAKETLNEAVWTRKTLLIVRKAQLRNMLQIEEKQIKRELAQCGKTIFKERM